jgi:hypothetical protein
MDIISTASWCVFSWNWFKLTTTVSSRPVVLGAKHEDGDKWVESEVSLVPDVMEDPAISDKLEQESEHRGRSKNENIPAPKLMIARISPILLDTPLAGSDVNCFARTFNSYSFSLQNGSCIFFFFCHAFII